jgi:ABC-type multidrug transport system fused ATPase/permease subunit
MTFSLHRYTKLAAYIKKYWRVAVLMLVCVVLLTILRVVIPILLGDAISDIQLHLPLETILVISLEIVAINALSALFQFGLGYGGQVIGQKIIYDMRNQIFVALQNQSFSFHDRNETGQLMSRATGDVEAVRRFLAFGSSQILGNTFLMGGVIIALYLLSFKLAVAVTAVFPLLVLISWKYAQTQGPHWKFSREHYGAMNSVLQQNITGMRIVRAFSAEESEIRKFEEKNRAYRDDIVNAANIRAVFSPLLTLLVSLDMGVLLLIFGAHVIPSTVQIGTLVAAINLLALLVAPIRFLGQLILLFQNGMAGFDRVVEITESTPEIRDTSGSRELDRANIRGEIKFENVTFGYGGSRERLILKGVNLVIKPGEIVALLGSTGSGKTTLANLVPRFYDVTSGRVLIDGIDVRDLKLKSLRSNVGIVSQDIFLFSATIFDNIAYGKPDATIEEVETAAKVAHSAEFIERFPEKYSTLVGERGVTLSGGQKQRVSIARTLLVDPKILILDDSLSSVDVETEYAIQDALRSVVRGRTTLIITQRLSTLRLAQRIIVFEDGKIAEQGSHEELLRANGLYKKLFNAQIAQQEEEEQLRVELEQRQIAK